MSDIGPALPPHLLAKRKRKQEDESKTTDTTDSGAKSTNVDAEKRRKVAGPAMPPAPLDERPEIPPDHSGESSSDDDDDFGPALPSSHDNEVFSVEDIAYRQHG